MQSHAHPDLLLLEENIPFDIRISEQPGRYCDPMFLRVDVIGEEKFRWCVMTDDSVQFTFETFDDLYYRCDGPACFMVRIAHTRDEVKDQTQEWWHICLK